jgi:hypothetical protein
MQKLLHILEEKVPVTGGLPRRSQGSRWIQQSVIRRT